MGNIEKVARGVDGAFAGVGKVLDILRCTFEVPTMKAAIAVMAHFKGQWKKDEQETRLPDNYKGKATAGGWANEIEPGKGYDAFEAEVNAYYKDEKGKECKDADPGVWRTLQMYEKTMCDKGQEFPSQGFYRPMRMKNAFAAKVPPPGGYRDVKFNLLFKAKPYLTESGDPKDAMHKGPFGMAVSEVQIILDKYLHVKHKMHAIYRLNRGDFCTVPKQATERVAMKEAEWKKLAGLPMK